MLGIVSVSHEPLVEESVPYHRRSGWSIFKIISLLIGFCCAWFASHIPSNRSGYKQHLAAEEPITEMARQRMQLWMARQPMKLAGYFDPLQRVKVWHSMQPGRVSATTYKVGEATDKQGETKTFHNDVKGAMVVQSLPSLDDAAAAQREALRHTCARAEPFQAACEIRFDAPRAQAEAALTDGLALAERLPGASSEAIAGLHADVLACVGLWTQETGRTHAGVQMKLVRWSDCKNLHLDYVEARVVCTLYGKGTEWVPSPGALHAAASFTVARGGSALGDALKRAVAATAGPLQAAKEREALLIRGVDNPNLKPWQSRLHRSPNVDGCCGEWRLLLRVDAPVSS